MSNAKQRITLTNLTEPQQMRELNRQLSWIWDQLLGGLSMKSLNGAARSVIEGKLNASVFEQSEEAIRAEVSDLASGLQSQITQQSSEITLRVTQKQLEEGLADKLDADKPSVGVQTASAVVNEKGVYLSGGEIDMRTTDGEDYLNLSSAGASASSMSAPDVMPRYAGPDAIFVKPDATSQEIEAGGTYRGLQETLAALSGKVADRAITVYIAHTGTEFGDVSLDGAVFLNGLTVRPYDVSARLTLMGSVRVTGCSGHVSMWGIHVTSPAGVNGFHAESPSATIDLSAMKFQGAGSDGGIYVNWGTRLHMYDCQMYDYAYAVNVEHSCQAGLARTAGNCKIRSAWGSIVFVSDSAPDSTGTFSPEETWGGRVFAESGVYVDQGSGGSTPAVPTVNTLSVGVNAAVSYRASGGVWSDDNVIQGWWEGGGRIKGCMWFDNAAIRNALSGKTVLTASLRLHMNSSGRGTQVTVELAGTSANVGGNPAVTKTYGAIATMSPKETATITLPVQAVNDLVSGMINGLMLYSSDTGPHKEREYSKNYAAFAGADSGDALKPVLTITYKGV